MQTTTVQAAIRHYRQLCRELEPATELTGAPLLCRVRQKGLHGVEEGWVFREIGFEDDALWGKVQETRDGRSCQVIVYMDPLDIDTIEFELYDLEFELHAQSEEKST